MENQMSGTKIGGIKARQTNYLKHGKDFYREIGRIGGRISRGGGFAANPELARIAGKKGGTISRRTGVKNGYGKKRVQYEDERVNYQSY